MPDIASLISIYQSERGRLVNLYKDAKSQAFKEIYLRAIRTVDICVAVLPKFPGCASSISDWSVSRLEILNERMEKNLASMKSGIDAVRQLQIYDEPQKQAVIDQLVSVSKLAHKNARISIEMQIAQAEFLQAACDLWFESLEDVCKVNSSGFRDRVDLIFSFAASKLPVVGALAELLTLAAELYAASKKKAISADEHMVGIERFFDLAHIWLVGAFTFIAQIRHLSETAITPTDEEIMQLVSEHLDKTLGRTTSTDV